MSRRLSTSLFLFLVLHPCFALSGVSERSKVDDGSVVLLMERIDSYYGLFKAHKYAEAYEMLQSIDREGKKDKREWVRAGKKQGNGLRISEWKVAGILIGDEHAKVEMKIYGKLRAASGWEEFSEMAVDYWLFEHDNWYFIPVNLDGWDESKAVEVPVPQLSLSVSIRTKD